MGCLKNQVNDNHNGVIIVRDDAHSIIDYGTFNFVESEEEIPPFNLDSCPRSI